MSEVSLDRWAGQEFGGAGIADVRWGQRLVKMAAQAARSPAGRVSETFVRGDERQGAYGLLESKAVDAAAVGQAMFEATARRCAGEDFVFCPVDGTSLTLTDHGISKGFGPIGSRASGGRGLKVMNAMVLSSDGVPLGVSSQRWWTRPARKRAKHRDQLGPDKKETRHWLEAMKQTREVMEKHAPDTRCWFQLDREGDAWPMLLEAGAGKHWFTIRSSWDRRVRSPGGEKTQLRSLLANQPVRTTYVLQVKATAKRRARAATLVVRAATVTLDIRDKRDGKRFSCTLNVVQARELGTTPAGEKPLDWTLLTNRPIETTRNLTDVIFGYSMRWRIEELHRTWKSGACRVEETQLRSASAVIKWATILMAVAVRIERIKQLSRETPELPASEEFSPAEIKAVILLRFGKRGKAKLVSPPQAPTIAQLTLWIAELGGYTGRTSSGGPPGSIVIARGLESVRAAAQALEALSSD
jgi:Transposase DNA-binding